MSVRRFSCRPPSVSFGAIGLPAPRPMVWKRLAVKNYVLQNFPGVTAARFQTIGRGGSNPIASNETEGGRQLNRRTDIKVVLAAGG